jgi:hypothetical protein
MNYNKYEINCLSLEQIQEIERQKKYVNIDVPKPHPPHPYYQMNHLAVYTNKYAITRNILSPDKLQKIETQNRYVNIIDPCQILYEKSNLVGFTDTGNLVVVSNDEDNIFQYVYMINRKTRSVTKLTSVDTPVSSYDSHISPNHANRIDFSDGSVWKRKRKK